MLWFSLFFIRTISPTVPLFGEYKGCYQSILSIHDDVTLYDYLHLVDLATSHSKAPYFELFPQPLWGTSNPYFNLT